jgi:lysine-ketoglutarate reductase/saccharopine dehydrogenase-like protein (TIGR00300 family)
LRRRFISEGHLIDSGILAQILNRIIEEGADYDIVNFTIGKTNLQPSRIELDLVTSTAEETERITALLISIGCYEKTTPEVVTYPAPADGCAPDGFYSTTNYRTEVFVSGDWQAVRDQRMDSVIVLAESGPVCMKIRDLHVGDPVVCGSDAVRVHPLERQREADYFGFMTGQVSSERSMDLAVAHIADDLIRERERGGRVVAVAGPVVVHTGGTEAFSGLIREGYIQGLLAGNALAVHDIENQFFGTSLGVEQESGRPMPGGHSNHMRAINTIRSCGGIHAAIERGILTSGVMYQAIASDIDWCLAGSIRDDGPLPETEMNILEAQQRYAEIIDGATMVLMLASMLHSIGTGNMLPAWVKSVCVDINPAVVTKLADRGSSQAVGVVCDVGLLLRALAGRLNI